MKRVGTLTLVVYFALSGGSVATADQAAWMFEPDHVTEIDLELPEASREALEQDPDEYVEGTFSLTRDDGTTYGPLLVGVRLKGTWSFRTLAGKAAFKVKFNEFVKGQKFLGLKSLTLNNMVQDRTMLHEMLSYEAFRAAGLPGWRTGYSYVRVNGADYGVYLNLETPDDVSLPRWYPTTQHLYEGGVTADLNPGGEDKYEVDEGDENDLADLQALIAAVAAWENVDDVADLDQMTRFWAVERYIGHWDGYSGPLPNNYYLHSDDQGRFTMLPWGTDQTWADRRDYFGTGGILYNACLADPACRALYSAAVEDIRATLGAVEFDRRVTDTAALLAPWQQLDPRREHSLDQTAEGVTAMREFIAWRRPQTPPPPPPDPPTTDGEENDVTQESPPPPIDSPAPARTPVGEPPSTVPVAPARLKLTVSPGRVRSATSAHITFLVTSGGQAVPRARISFAGRKLRTDRNGQAVVSLRLMTPRVIRARAGATGHGKATARVRVLPAG